MTARYVGLSLLYIWWCFCFPGNRIVMWIEYYVTQNVQLVWLGRLSLAPYLWLILVREAYNFEFHLYPLFYEVGRFY